MTQSNLRLVQVRADLDSRAASSGPGRVRRPRRRSDGRFRQINWFVDARMAQLTSAERAVWITLWREERSGTSTASHKYLAARCGVSRRAVVTAVKLLMEKQLLELIRKGGPPNHANQYRLARPE